MRGDFSKWDNKRRDNFNGVLHQQGRVLLDSDWNAQSIITNNWQDTAGTDIIGSGVAAIPADEPDGFKVNSASVQGGKVKVVLLPGRVWADGLLVYLDEQKEFIANYLQPPLQDPPSDPSKIGPDVRDAVILEVWRDEINAFQIPEQLLEPALGGPDTTERIHTSIAIKLFRLGLTDTCDNIADKLKDDFSKKGKLTVSLKPTTVISGDCPVVEGGGYTGFEHNLYRIEIAETNSGEAMFKWSQFNGGLVGRGKFEAGKVTITGNPQPIKTSGLNEFYLEAVEYESTLADKGLGHWNVTYGAKATLDGDQLTLGTTMFGTVPGSTKQVFFRLWNEIRKIGDFPSMPNPVELRDGIRLEFDAATAGNYAPGDYWTFPVRAGEIKNEQVLLDKKAPQGIGYHRVPLAVLHWNSSTTTGSIEDCRRIFQPLTKLATCCSYRVGDGKMSHGDFDTIKKALEHLPHNGGEICVLPGNYTENILIYNKANITIRGCGDRSKIISAAPASGAKADPVIHVIGSKNIRIESLAIAADKTGIGILLENSPPEKALLDNGAAKMLYPLSYIDLAELNITAAAKSAIEVYDGQFITIRDCLVDMEDIPGNWPGIFFIGDDSTIENNIIQVKPGPKARISNNGSLLAGAGLGGLQIGGTSERVRIINNLIKGGIEKGITLGNLHSINRDNEEDLEIIGAVIEAEDLCAPCKPGNILIKQPEETGGRRRVYRSAGTLYEIHIERNRIFNMGLSGIGVTGFFDLSNTKEIISVHRLTIIGNEIRYCLQRELTVIDPETENWLAYGAITLADVEYLIIHDNIIEDNGPTYIEPICGIFILWGEGIDISRNRILNNGAKTKAAQSKAKNGLRGGINIGYGITPTLPEKILGNQLQIQDGVPAVKVHDNIVTVPLGQALSLTAVGPVSVINNHFTSRGVVQNNKSPSFAATIQILNLGLYNDELYWLLFFWAIKNGQVKSFKAPAVENNRVNMKRPESNRAPNRYFADGRVLFSNNHCMLDLMETGRSSAITSIIIFTLDDLGFHNNQCECNLFDDFVWFHAFLFGFSLRVSDNYLREGIFNALFSAVTAGTMNATTNNQTTHCNLIGPPGIGLVDEGNKVFLQVLNSKEEDYCNPLKLFWNEKIQ